jgi:hypothetical protein
VRRDQTLKTTHASRVARFFLTQCTKSGENIPNNQKIAKSPLKMQNCHKKFQLAIKHISLFHSKALQNMTKLVFLV